MALNGFGSQLTIKVRKGLFRLPFCLTKLKGVAHEIVTQSKGSRSSFLFVVEEIDQFQGKMLRARAQTWIEGGPTI